jgi:hypothetical protein
MLTIAAATVIPIAFALILATVAFMSFTAVTIRSQRRAQVNESPLAAEFWQHSPERVKPAVDHARPKRPRRSGRRSLPTIHFVTNDRRDPSAYALPDAYSLVGSAPRSGQ